LLLPGDIERGAERDLAHAQQSLAADVLVVPHHGSKTSSTTEFLQWVRPKVAVFTVGYRNRFGHPKSAVVSRYREIGSSIYRSDEDGAVLIDYTDNGISIVRWRSKARRYWHDTANTGASLLAENEAAR
jgi:competence protein ComEC